MGQGLGAGGAQECLNLLVSGRAVVFVSGKELLLPQGRLFDGRFMFGGSQERKRVVTGHDYRPAIDYLESDSSSQAGQHHNM